jgi:hypothetical protein
MTEIRQCWAYNKEGQRCDHPAGHPNNHVVMKEWGDDECYSPIIHQLPAQATAVKENAPIPLPEPLVHEPLKCVGCGHQHKGGPCKCGCYEFIG